MWVLRDLSNGDGADGRPMPTYVWAFRTRAEALEQRRKHQRTPEWARLGPVEYWADETLYRSYRYVNTIGVGHYWRQSEAQ